MSDADLHKYIVTVQRHEDLEEFYHDMETPGGSQYIPNRSVDLALRRPYSRNTHYMLTHEEANLLKQDPRVISVELYSRMPKAISPTAKVGEIFSTSQSRYHSSYHLLKQANGINTTYPYTNNTGVYGSSFTSASYGSNVSGRDVDILAIDGGININHPEWLNASGQSRLVQYNWFQHSASLGYSGIHGTNFVYGSFAGGDLNHGTSATSLAAGRRFSWAPEANIYHIPAEYTNISNGSIISSEQCYDYIIAWLNSRQVNPTYGNKNPVVIFWNIQYFSPGFDTGISSSIPLTDNLALPLPNCYFIYNASINAGIYSYGPYSLTTIYQSEFRMLEAAKNNPVYAQYMNTDTDYTITVGELRDKYNLFLYSTGSYYAYSQPSTNWHLQVGHNYSVLMADLVDLASRSDCILITPAGNQNTQMIDGSNNLYRYNQYIGGNDNYFVSVGWDVESGFGYATHRYTMAAQQASYSSALVASSVSANTGPVVIGALQPNNTLATYTGYGSRLDGFCYADQVIAGSTFTDRLSPTQYYDNPSYSQSYFYGTSASTPISASIAALYAQAYRNSSPNTSSFRNFIQNNVFSESGSIISTSGYGPYSEYAQMYWTNGSRGQLSGSPNRILTAGPNSNHKRVVNPNTVTATELKTVFGDTDPVVLSDYYRGGSIVSSLFTAVPQSGQISYSNLKAQGPGNNDSVFDLVSVQATTARSGESYTITVRGNIPAPENITVNITTTATGSNVYPITIPSGSAVGTLTAILPTSGYFTQTATITATGKYDSNRIELRHRTCSWQIVASVPPFAVSGTPSYFNYSGSGTQTSPYTGESTNMGINGSTANITFLASVSGTVYYNFSTSSEIVDIGYILKNGLIVAQESGLRTASGTISVIANDTIEVRYRKDYSVHMGSDKLTLNSLYLI